MYILALESLEKMYTKIFRVNSLIHRNSHDMKKFFVCFSHLLSFFIKQILLLLQKKKTEKINTWTKLHVVTLNVFVHQNSNCLGWLDTHRPGMGCSVRAKLHVQTTRLTNAHVLSSGSEFPRALVITLSTDFITWMYILKYRYSNWKLVLVRSSKIQRERETALDGGCTVDWFLFFCLFVCFSF